MFVFDFSGFLVSIIAKYFLPCNITVMCKQSGTPKHHVSQLLAQLLSLLKRLLGESW